MTAAVARRRAVPVGRPGGVAPAPVGARGGADRRGVAVSVGRSAGSSGVPRLRVVVQHAPGGGEKSLPKVFRRGIDAEAFERWCVDAFADWLRATFGTPERAAPVFGVNVRTAENWFAKRNMASGNHVGLAFLAFPCAMDFFVRSLPREWGE